MAFALLDGGRVTMQTKCAGCRGKEDEEIELGGPWTPAFLYDQKFDCPSNIDDVCAEYGALGAREIARFSAEYMALLLLIITPFTMVLVLTLRLMHDYSLSLSVKRLDPRGAVPQMDPSDVVSTALMPCV